MPITVGRRKLSELSVTRTSRERHRPASTTSTVFDVKQTSGQELPTPPAVTLLETASSPTETLYSIVVAWLEQDGVTVRRGVIHANGLYQPGPPPVITVHERLQGDQKLKTLVPENGHHAALKRGYRIDRPDNDRCLGCLG